MFQKLANSEGVGLQIEKILDDFTWNDLGDNSNSCWGSTVECIQYCGGIPSVLWGDDSSTCGGIASVLWGIASVLWGDNFSTVGDSFSTVEVVQYSGGITSVQWGIASVLWRVFSTLG